MLKRIAKQERTRLHKLGVSSRKAERIRNRIIRESEEGDRGASHLFYLILDPELEAELATISEGF